MRARSHSGRLSFPRARLCEPARILGAEVSFVRARSYFERLCSLRRQPREPAHILGAEVTFARIRSLSGRDPCSAGYVHRYGFDFFLEGCHTKWHLKGLSGGSQTLSSAARCQFLFRAYCDFARMLIVANILQKVARRFESSHASFAPDRCAFRRLEGQGVPRCS